MSRCQCKIFKTFDRKIQTFLKKFTSDESVLNTIDKHQMYTCNEIENIGENLKLLQHIYNLCHLKYNESPDFS